MLSSTTRYKCWLSAVLLLHMAAAASDNCAQCIAAHVVVKSRGKSRVCHWHAEVLRTACI